MPAFLIRYPKGQGEDILADDDPLHLEIRDGWAVLIDHAGVCIAIPSGSGATITRIDPDQPEDQQPEE